jgi:hypothetical protein
MAVVKGQGLYFAHQLIDLLVGGHPLLDGGLIPDDDFRRHLQGEEHRPPVVLQDFPEFAGLQGIGGAVGPGPVAEAAGDLALQGHPLIHRDLLGLDDRRPGGPQLQGLLSVALQVLGQAGRLHVHRDFFHLSAHKPSFAKTPIPGKIPARPVGGGG